MTTSASPTSVTVLVTGAKGPAGRALGRQLAVLRDEGLDLVTVGADLLPGADQDWTTTATLPRVDLPSYPTALRRLLDTHGVYLLVPTVSEELTLVAQLAGILDEGEGSPRAVVSSAGATAVCADKLYTMWALEAAGVSVPRYLAGEEVSGIAAAMAELGGPIIVKPRVSRGGRGVRLVEDLGGEPVELDANHLVQSFAPGVEYCPQVYRSPVTGEVLVVVIEKTELKEGRIGNAAAAHRLGPDEALDVAWLAERAVTALDLVGPIDLDIRRDEDGVPVVLEVNARFGANSALAPELLRHVLTDWGVLRPDRAGV